MLIPNKGRFFFSFAAAVVSEVVPVPSSMSVLAS